MLCHATSPRRCRESVELHWKNIVSNNMDRRSDLSIQDSVSLRMKRVKQRNTAPELIVRQILFAAGYRYRIHRMDLPGSPDIVFPGRRMIIFVNGCFWHGHENCVRASLPKTRSQYWKDRILKNQERDARSIAALEKLGWIVDTIWECQTKDVISLEDRLVRFLDRGAQSIE